MPRPRPLHLQREKTRHGKVVWYARVGQGPRTRLRAPYGTPAFQAEYEAAISGKPIAEAPKAVGGSVKWLIGRYRKECPEWLAYSPATRRQRENIFRQVTASAGRQPIAALTREKVVQGRDRRAATPAQARHFLDTLRGLFRWALEAGHAKSDPTDGVKSPKKRKGRGFPPWTEEEVDLYYARWPLGTKERVWIDVIQYTGLRRGDAVQLGRQHVRNGIATLRTEKSGEVVTVTLPILPTLQATLDAGPCADLAFICGTRGEPLTKESFGNAFREAVRDAGVHKKSAHGLRKIGAIRAAEAGATVNELEAIFGWEGGRMASLYTKEASRSRLSKSAMDKLQRTAGEQSIPAPDGKVREA